MVQTDLDIPEKLLGTEVILGKKKKNPYSVKNMIIAQSFINKKLGKKNTTDNIKTTHLYIVFNPTTKEHLNKLIELSKNDDIALFNYPMDYEVIQEGSYYLDKSVSDIRFNPIYTAVTIDFNIPDVPYKVLEKLYIPTVQNNIETTSIILTKVSHPF